MKDDDCRCFGHYQSKNSNCKDCEYLHSCQMYTVTEGRMEQINPYNIPYDEVEEFAGNIATETIEYYDDTSEIVATDLKVIYQQTVDFFSFILNLEDYDLGILREIIAPTTGNKMTVADIARLRHISRQAVHRKILDMARKNPELREILRCVLLKLQKNRKLFENSPVKNRILESQKQLQLELF